MLRTLIAALCALVPAASLTTGAAAQVSAEQRVLREVVTVTPEGERVVTEEPAARVAPGDRVIYRLAYTNEGAAPATGLVLVMPVPEGIVLDPSATEGPGAVAFSLEGERFAALGDLTRPDGAAATAADVRSVRWTLGDPVPPGGSGEVAFKGVLR